jgi:tetratricopeptide (TPR) repeat protein
MTSCTADRRRRRRGLSALPLSALALALLAPAAHADLADEMAKMRSAPSRDVPLYTMQAGVAAFAEGQRGQAADLFDTALTGIESMYANTENATRARSLWYEEGAKEFKGEPYERAMAYYYRGLLYLGAGDYENARASFRGGLLQDAFAEEQQFRSDFAMLMVLEGWANQLNGDAALAREAYDEAGKLRPKWHKPAADANVLVVAELAGSPRKLGDGIGNSEIVYRRPKRTPERHAVLTVNGKPLALELVEDVYFQAATRGGRPIDRVIEGKASFASTSGEVGSVLAGVASEGSLIAAANGGGGGRALGAVAAIGAISSILSANVKPRADVRYWANLPETLHVAALRLDGDPGAVKVDLTDENGQPVASSSLRIQTFRDARGNGLIWIKSRN